MRLSPLPPIAVVASLLWACEPTKSSAPTGSSSAPSAASAASGGAASTTPAAAPSAAASAPRAIATELHGERRDLSSVIGGAQRIAVGDLDGDGQAEIVGASSEQLVVSRLDGTRLAVSEARGAAQVLSIVDLGDGGAPRIFVGWGADKSNQRASSSVAAYRLVGRELQREIVVEPESTRHEITSIVPMGRGAVALGHFVDTFHVSVLRAAPGAEGWRTELLTTTRMATSLAYGDTDGDGRSALVVGRVYGDERGVDGDAFELREGGTRMSIPTLRGVRGMALADSDGDGLPELFLGDGWHQDYGKVARARLARARWVDGTYLTEALAELPGQFTIWQILPLDVDGDGRPEILSRGNLDVWVHRERAGRWQSLRVAGLAEHLAGGKLDDEPGERVLVAGPKPELLDLRALAWPP